MILGIYLKSYALYMKYVLGFNDYLKELKLYSVGFISKKSVKATSIEGKLNKVDLDEYA